FCSFFHYAASFSLYSSSLHDALPIFSNAFPALFNVWLVFILVVTIVSIAIGGGLLLHCVENGALDLNSIMAEPLQCQFDLLDRRSEEHTSELQSRENLVRRLLLEK